MFFTIFLSLKSGKNRTWCSPPFYPRFPRSPPSFSFWVKRYKSVENILQIDIKNIEKKKKKKKKKLRKKSRWSYPERLPVGDILNLIVHSIMEIKICITFISNTFLIRLTVYEILRVFWKMAFENTQAPCTVLRDCYGNMHTLTIS